MDWTYGHLTTKEMEKALLQAGINPDCSQWSSDDVERASEVLDKATTERRAHPLDKE